MQAHRQPRAENRQPQRSGITLRSILLCLILIPLNAWWLIETEYIRYSDNCTTQALFFNAITLLLLLLLLNKLLWRISPRWVLLPQELVCVYVVAVIASNLAGHDQLQILFTTLTYVFRHDTPETGWGTKIIPYLPDHLMMHDKVALDALYMGNTTLYQKDHILPWLAPLGWWLVFTMLVIWTMLCLVSLFRKQWDSERLNYPIAEIPIQILTGQSELFRHKVLWVGFAIGAMGQILNMIHSLFPSVPGIMLGVQTYNLTGFPWSAMGTIPVCTYPFALGLCFLLPTQLGFSCWFFFLTSRLLLVAAAMWGYSEVNPWSSSFPYIQQQGVGAILGIFLITVWTARGHLKSVWQLAWGKTPDTALDDSDEPLSYRTAVFGLMGGIIGLVCFATAAGMRWHVAALFLGILFIIIVVVTRLRAELGLPTYELYQVGADQILQNFSGTAAYTRNDLTVMSLFFWLCRTHRQFPMQSQADAMRLGRRTQTSLRSVGVMVLCASLLGVIAAFWAMLHSTYQVGFESAKFRGPALWAFGREPWVKLDNWMSSPRLADRGALGAYAFGTLFTLFLSGMRAHFMGWPLHPAGYMVSGSFGLFRLWLPIFLAWLVKSLLLRYGGLRAYRRALPFFIGLILGEFAAGFARSVLDTVFQLHLPPSSGIGGL